MCDIFTCPISVNLGFPYSCRLGWTALKAETRVFQTHLKSKRLRYALKNIGKPNFIRPLRSVALQNKSCFLWNYRNILLKFIKSHHRCQFSDFSRYFVARCLQMLQKHPSKNPLRGLVLLVLTLLHRYWRNAQANKPYGTKEGFWRVQSFWLKPGAVRNSAYRIWGYNGYFF